MIHLGDCPVYVDGNDAIRRVAGKVTGAALVFDRHGQWVEVDMALGEDGAEVRGRFRLGDWSEETDPSAHIALGLLGVKAREL